MSLIIKDLYARVKDGAEILKGVNLNIPKGEVHAIMGPNGSGKSTLSKVLCGHPDYEVTGGSAEMDGQDLFSLSVDERSRAGLFLAFQYPVEVPGVSNANFMRAALQARLPKEEELRIEAPCKCPESPQEIPVDAVSHIQTKAGNAELLMPEPYALKDVVPDRRLTEIQLHKIIAALPFAVGKAVIVRRIAAEVYIKPIPVRTLLPVFKHVLKGKEAPAHMIEDSVKHDPETCFLKGPAYGLQVLVRTKTSVKEAEIPRIIAMLITFKQGIEKHGVKAAGLDMVDIVKDCEYGSLSDACLSGSFPMLLIGLS